MRKQGYFTKTSRGRSASILLSGLLLCLLTLSNTYTYAINDQQTITLNVQNASLEKVFKEIEKQTHFSFLYMQAVLKNAKHVNVKVSNATIEKVLELCFKDQPGLTYSIMDRVVVVKVKAAVGEGQGKKEGEDPIDVSGRVTDEEGKPLVGANVKVKGANTGVMTDGEGRFTLKNIGEDAVLEISYVGHESQIVKVKGQRMLAINLKQMNSVLDEAVVIAYGTTTKRLNTGNIASVKSEDIDNQPVNNPLLALQGRVPGLLVTQGNGLSGSAVTVRIQGQNSIGMGNDPLYVVDGTPYPSQLLPGLGSVLGNGQTMYGITSNGNPFSYINPGDIESIEVLKDADATAIYGSRAANGAILITTKKGISGKTKVDLNIQNGWGQVPRRLVLLNSMQYIEMREEAIRNDGGVPSLANGDYDLLLWETDRYTDWQKTLLGGTANIRNVQVGISGGNSNTQFLISNSFHNETTVFPGHYSDTKGSIHFNVNNSSSDRKFKTLLNFTGLIDNNKLPSQDLTLQALQLAPVAPPLFKEDGSLNWAPNSSGTSTWENPLSLNEKIYKNKATNILGNIELSYQITSEFQIKANFGYNNLKTNEISTIPLSSIAPENRPNSLRRARYSNSELESWIIEPLITYKQRLGRILFDGLVGGTLQENKSNVLAVDGTGYNSDLVLEDIKSASSLTAGLPSMNSKYKYNAIFGRLNFQINDKYVLNFVARRDGSSRFGSNDHFHNFGSVGGAWVFSEEKLLKKLSFLKFGKLRGTYGTTGNDQIGDYKYLSLYRPLSNIGVAYQGVIGLAPIGLSNPYLQWEETKKLQFGIDLGFWGNKIILNVNYYRNSSSNQLLDYSLPIMVGFGGITKNFPATVTNSGWEMFLNGTLVKSSNFIWNSSFNLTLPKNKLNEFPNLSSSSYANSLVIGKPITILKLFHYIGVDPANGTYIFEGSNGSPTSFPNDQVDKTVIINRSPSLFGGIQNSFKYKGLEIDFLFQFVKQTGANYVMGFIPGYAGYNQPTYILDRWQKPGDNAAIQRYNSDFSLLTPWFKAQVSDLAYSNATFARLKNLSVSWNFPDLWCDNLHLRNLRIYTQGQNLLTFTNFKGLDPENPNTNSLPPLRVITIGIQLGL